MGLFLFCLWQRNVFKGQFEAIFLLRIGQECLEYGQKITHIPCGQSVLHFILDESIDLGGIDSSTEHIAKNRQNMLVELHLIICIGRFLHTVHNCIEPFRVDLLNCDLPTGQIQTLNFTGYAQFLFSFIIGFTVNILINRLAVSFMVYDETPHITPICALCNCFYGLLHKSSPFCYFYLSANTDIVYRIV